MKNIKYYILAYSMLIYLFLEKYLTLIYLLVKTQFTDKTKNIDIFKDIENEISFNTYNGYDSMYAPLFYNEYKQLFYHDYFIGE